MKKLLILFISASSFSTAFAQDSPALDYRHEIGLDVSPLVRQVFSSGSTNQGNSYYLMYRYHLNNWAVRARAGGYIRSETQVVNDSIIQGLKGSYMEFRLGLERKVDLAPKWQLFYGMDLMLSEEQSWNKTESRPGMTQVSENSLRRYGAAPLLGFRFWISSRMSLATETAFLFYFFEGHNSRKYTPDDRYNQTVAREGFGTQLYAPVSLFFTYNF